MSSVTFSEVYGRVWRIRDGEGIAEELRGRPCVVVRKDSNRPWRVLVRVKGCPSGAPYQDDLWGADLWAWDRDFEEIK